MRRKTKGYLALAIAGLAMLIAALLLRVQLSDLAGGVLLGVGCGLAALGTARFLHGRMEETHPAYRRAQEIEQSDERNVAIRRRAQALSGTVLQWLTIAAAWAAILLDAPLWVTLALTGAFLGKTVLETALTVHYQKVM